MKPTTINDIVIGACSLTGGKTANEDSFIYIDTPMGVLIVVCDGLGGPIPGKTASRLATQTIATYVKSMSSDSNPLLTLEDAAASANAAISDAAAADPTLKGMGTTCVCAIINGDKAYVMHVGDSRCYVLRHACAAFRTADHSYVGELVSKGSISEEMARTSQYANVLTRALGVFEYKGATTETLQLEPGDRLAFMTDGIWGAVPQKKLINMLCGDENVPTLVENIANLIDANGKKNGNRHDNMTLVVAELEGRQPSGIVAVTPESAEFIDYDEEYDNSNENRAVDEAANGIAGKNDDTEYELTEINDPEEDYDDDESTESKRKTLIWIFSIGLAIALGIIIYLTVWSTGYNAAATEDSTKTAIAADSTTDSLIDSTANAGVLAEEVQTPQAAAPTSSPVSSPSYSYRNSYYSNQDYSAEEETDSEADQTIAEPAGPDNTAAKACLSAAAGKLETLKDFDPKGIAKKDTRKRRQKRTDLFNEAVASLKEGIASTEDAALKAEITQLGQELTNPSTKSKILKMDEETGKSTRASVTTIEAFTTRLRTLAE